MIDVQRIVKSLHVTQLGAALACAIGMMSEAAAQKFEDVRTPDTPLVLKSKGSFYVGGQKVDQSASELGSLSVAGPVTVNQMYVEFMVPQSDGTQVPVVMLHGATLSAKTYDTTPDGRMGWAEYFVRKGHAVYLPDQVSRGRSGFNQAIYNNVRAGNPAPGQQPFIFRFSDNEVWQNFRFGATVGAAFADTKFPIEALDELSKQSIPDLIATLPASNPTWHAMSELAIKLNGAVLLSHSQSGRFPLEVAALVDSKGISGMVLIEPGRQGCKAKVYTDQQVAVIAKIPFLVVFGDNLTIPNGTPGLSWKESYDDCLALIDRVNAMKGNAKMLYPPDRGIKGNSHMIMHDRNNIQIADIILDWIDKNVEKKALK